MTIWWTVRPRPGARLSAVLSAVLLAMLMSAAWGQEAPDGDRDARDGPAAKPSDSDSGSDSGTADARGCRNRSPGAENLERAREHFARANALVGDYRLTDAASAFCAALAQWDHPIIHYNLSRTYLALGRPLDAYYHIDQALRDGPEALQTDDGEESKNYQRARQLKDELRRQIAAISTTAGPGVEVFIDSQKVDGSRPHLVLPGSHRVVAQKNGHRTYSSDVTVGGDETARLTLTSQRPLSRKTPWIVTGSGVALIATGSVLFLTARSDRNSLETDASTACGILGCTDDDASSLSSRWNSARLRSAFGAGSLITGGAVLLTGIGLIVWNRQQSFTMTRSNESPKQQARQQAVIPVISPTMTGVTGILSF